jgi:hypothetical protein
MPETAGEGTAQRDGAAFTCVEAVCKRTDAQGNYVIIGIPAPTLLFGGARSTGAVAIISHALSAGNPSTPKGSRIEPV